MAKKTKFRNRPEIIPAQKTAKKSKAEKSKNKGVAAKKAARTLPKEVTTWQALNNGVLVPGNATPIPVSKFREGFKRAKPEITSIIDEFTSTMTESYNITEIELSVSFSADGKFMGFGIGGAASIKIKIKPVRVTGA